MSFLLDTHVILWFLEGNHNLSLKARISIENSNYTKFISMASIWEIAIKLNLAKLRMEIGLDQLKAEILQNGFELLPLRFEHFFELSKLVDIHKDPFDRILISQALCENLRLISGDKNFSQYKSLDLLW